MRFDAAGVPSEAFWSPFGPLIHRKAGRGGPLAHRRSSPTVPGGPEGDHGKRPPDMMKPRRETYSHLGFYVGLTVCWFRTSVTGVSRHGGLMSRDIRN